MKKYCIDTDFLIQSKNGPYDFAIAPGFWDWLDQEFSTGKIYSSSMVYYELVDGNDELAEWIKERKDSKIFVKPNDIVQSNNGKIANYVNEEYPSYQSKVFLEKADSWVIAQAMSDDSVVVTFEVLVPEVSNKVKIPNICNVFNVQYIEPYEMMRKCKVQFGLINK